MKKLVISVKVSNCFSAIKGRDILVDDQRQPPLDMVTLTWSEKSTNQIVKA